MTPGRKIKNLRLDRGLAQFKLAEMVGLTCSALSKMESDINYPRSAAAYRIARALCVTVEYLIDESIPYPYVPPEKPDVKHPTKKVRASITRKESLFLDALRRASKQARKIAFEVPYLTDEMLMAVHMALNGRLKKRKTKGR